MTAGEQEVVVRARREAEAKAKVTLEVGETSTQDQAGEPGNFLGGLFAHLGLGAGAGDPDSATSMPQSPQEVGRAK